MFVGASDRWPKSKQACELDAAAIAGTLTIRIVAGDRAALGHLEDVVVRHLKRFAPKDPLEGRWTRAL